MVWAKKKKLKFGYGLRLTSYFGYQNSYKSAPAQIVKQTSGPAVLFAKTLEKNLNFIESFNPQINFINSYIILQYTFAQKFDIGFNIDIIGFGIGGNTDALFKNSLQSKTTTPVSVSQANFNLLLIDVNDIGNLNSELFLRYWITQKWAAKIAINHFFTEIKTDIMIQTIPSQNDRFRLVSDLITIGVTFKPWE